MDKKLDIHIEADFGSMWQRKSQGQTLELMIKAWAEFMKPRHKKNRVWINGAEVI